MGVRVCVSSLMLTCLESVSTHWFCLCVCVCRDTIRAPHCPSTQLSWHYPNTALCTETCSDMPNWWSGWRTPRERNMMASPGWVFITSITAMIIMTDIRQHWGLEAFCHVYTNYSVLIVMKVYGNSNQWSMWQRSRTKTLLNPITFLLFVALQVITITASQ